MSKLSTWNHSLIKAFNCLFLSWSQRFMRIFERISYGVYSVTQVKKLVWLKYVLNIEFSTSVIYLEKWFPIIFVTRTPNDWSKFSRTARRALLLLFQIIFESFGHHFRPFCVAVSDTRAFDRKPPIYRMIRLANKEAPVRHLFLQKQSIILIQHLY